LRLYPNQQHIKKPMTFPDTLHQVSLLKTLNFIAVGLSFLGSGYMIYSCVTPKGSMSASTKFILAIAITDFFYTISNLMSGLQEKASESVQPLCQWEAVLRFLSFKLTLLFASCIAISCYKGTKLGKRFDQDRFFKNSLIAGVFVAIYLGVLFIGLDDLIFANTQLVCTLTVRKDALAAGMNARQTLIYFLFDLVPVFTMIIVTLVAYIGTMTTLKSLPKAVLEALDINIYRLLSYPAIQFVTFLPGLINQFLFFISSTNDDSVFKLVFNIVQVFLLHSIGFINAINYGVQQIKSRKIKEEGSFESTGYECTAPSARSSYRNDRNLSVEKSLMHAQYEAF